MPQALVCPPFLRLCHNLCLSLSMPTPTPLPMPMTLLAPMPVPMPHAHAYAHVPCRMPVSIPMPIQFQISAFTFHIVTYYLSPFWLVIITYELVVVAYYFLIHNYSANAYAYHPVYAYANASTYAHAYAHASAYSRAPGPLPMLTPVSTSSLNYFGLATYFANPHRLAIVQFETLLTTYAF